ncbi:MAG: hypothetical protein ACHQDC_06060 [Acidimicrobiales bacterium]
MSSVDDASRGPRRRGQGGFVAGSDGLIFGTLVLLCGSLMIVNAWAAIDTRIALDSAAREYLRTYGEQPDGTTARAAGERAARTVLSRRGTNPSDLTFTTEPRVESFGPCQLAEVGLTVTVPAIEVPFLEGVGSRSVSVTHTELVDAHRETSAGPTYSFDATPCAG